MSNNPCRKCGKPARYKKDLCYECAANEYLDDEMDGETWGDFFDDSTWDEERDYQNPPDFEDEDINNA